MTESILTSIKKLLGITEDCTDFDADLIIHINSVFMILSQLGIGPVKGFHIDGKENKWDEFVSVEDNLESVKTYVYLKVKLVFDPPLASAVIESIKAMISELEWRLQVAGDPLPKNAGGIQNGE